MRSIPAGAHQPSRGVRVEVVPRDKDRCRALIELKDGTDLAAQSPRAGPHADSRRAERRTAERAQAIDAEGSADDRPQCPRKGVEVTPVSGVNGRVTATVGILLGAHVRKTASGVTFGAETGFVLARDPDTVSAPDAAFVTKDHADGFRRDPRQPLLYR